MGESPHINLSSIRLKTEEIEASQIGDFGTFHKMGKKGVFEDLWSKKAFLRENRISKGRARVIQSILA